MQLILALKIHTAASHADLEKTLDVFSRIQTKSDYARLLGRFLTMYEPLEDQLSRAENWPERGLDFDSLRKASWLREDLAALGAPAHDIDSWERCNQLPETESLGAAIGCLYVLEGSTLGGRVISKRFGETLGIAPGSGGRFFNGYGAETGERWRAFGQWTRAMEEREGFLEPEATRAAKETFACFGRWLSF
jgi:heme oxygenase (biliverdin-IX-beta and delta-forming)